MDRRHSKGKPYVGQQVDEALFKAHCVIRTAVDVSPEECPKTMKQLNDISVGKPKSTWHAEAVEVHEEYINNISSTST